MQNNGVEGLGVLNENKAVTCVETPNGFLSKRDTDSRKLVTDFSRFTSLDKFNEYLKNWFIGTGLFNVSEVNANIKAQLNFSSIFYTMWISNNGNTSDNNCFCIVSCLNLDNVQTILSLLEGSNNPIIPNKAVLIYYGNDSNNIKDRAKKLGVELIGTEEMYDINNAIDNADKGLPYMSTNGSKFSVTIANKLNHLYKTKSIKENVSNSAMNTANTVGGSLAAAFTEGLEQLKSGVNSLINSIKSSTQNQQVQQGQVANQVPNEIQTPVQPNSMEQESVVTSGYIEAVEPIEQTGEPIPVVSLEKAEPHHLEEQSKSTPTSTVSLSKSEHKESGVSLNKN